MLARFIRWNRAWSYRLVPKWMWNEHASCIYENVGLDLIRRQNPSVVLDVGSGRRFSLDAESKEHSFTLIGIDVDPQELALNNALDLRIVSDASKSLCVDNSTASLILSHFAIEHIRNNDALLGNCYNALKPGGQLLVVFQSKYSTASILNRAIPDRLKLWFLNTLVPESDGHLGFPAYYDKCSYTEFRRALKDHGFVIELERYSFFNSDYFAFFAPLFAMSFATDLIRRWVGNPYLASQLLFLARKPA